MDRSEQTGQPARAEKTEQLAQPEKMEKTAQSGKTEQSEKMEQTAQSKKTGQTAQAEKMGQTEQAEKSEKVKQSEQTGQSTQSGQDPWNYHSLESIVSAAENRGQKISRLVLEQQAEQMEISVQKVYERMRENYRVMRECIEPGCDPEIRSASGLTGGSAAKMRRAAESGETLTGPVLAGALYRALAVSELNASMGRIVAAPTAGSCGILPAAVLTMEQERGIAEEECVMSLFTAAAVGMVIAENASLAGAEGGCQAECGAAAAMAAAAVTELAGGTPRMVSHAVAIALKNILGLVCDPVAGLVEIPCIKRNASGVAGAFVAAELALAGIESAIPADEVIWAMKKVGNAMSSALKETAEGGLAATPTGRKLREQVFG